MRIFGAFRAKAGEADLFYGEVLGAMVRRLRAPYWLGLERDGSPDAPLEELAVDVPVAPSKLIAVGRNYRAHAEERGAAVPASPLTWLKAPSSLLASGGLVELPYPAHRVDFEAELGIVIGRTAKNVAPKDAVAHIFGYTACLDISDRDIQDSEKQFARAKSFDTFTPAGPYVYQGVDAADLPLTLHQNGTLRQNGRTSEMIFPIEEIVSFCSQGTTLLPGDLILTGTPSGVGAVHAGDVLETRIGPFTPLIVHVRDAIAWRSRRERASWGLMVIKDLEIDDRLLALPYSIDVNDEGQIVLTPLQEPGLTWEQLATTHAIFPEDCHWKIETNKRNQIFMSPPPALNHQAFNGKITKPLARLLPEGLAFPEAGVQTSDGTRVPDVIWASAERWLAASGGASFSPAPEICVEIISPRNTRREIVEKTALYFEAGALEVWRCERNGAMRFAGPEGAIRRSRLCPAFPDRLDLFA